MDQLKSVPTQDQLSTFAKKYAWETQMDKSLGLDSWSNHSGSNLGDLVVVIGRNRDSDILGQSNFDAALECLGGESKTVMVERFGHWGCGWFELILVNPCDVKALTEAYLIKASLDEYPVLDDTDFYERETEYQEEFAEGAKQDLAEALALHFGLEGCDAKTMQGLVTLAFHLNIECQRHYGNDACVNIYNMREPDAHDLKRLHECIKQYLNNWSDDDIDLHVELARYIQACLGEETK